jgi:hypothetical protein
LTSDDFETDQSSMRIGLAGTRTLDGRMLRSGVLRIHKLLRMDEGRKRVLLIAASILAARKLAQFDGGKRVPATMSAIADAVRWAEEIMKAIDERWPAGR